MKKKIACLLLVFVMLVGILPLDGVFAGEGIEYLAYNEETNSFETAECTDYTVLTSGETSWTDGKWYVAPSGHLELGEVTVSGSAYLILSDGCDLVVKGGIRVNEGNSLTIFAVSDGENMGALTANGNDWCSGIGGGGNITICGGFVTATGGQYGAGIGGGNRGSGGNITICGGKVTANGGEEGAGIGGGYSGNGGNIAIYGGVVTANGGIFGAGIGGGYTASGGNVTISGGKVTATAGENAPRAIGRGAGDYSFQNDGSLTVPDEALISDHLSGVTFLRTYVNDWQRFFAGVSVSVTVDYISNHLSDSTVITKDTTEWTTGWYYAVGTLKIDAVTVKGDVTLVLADLCDLTVSGGIRVGDGNSLTILSESDGDNMGSLTANGNEFCAGIGGGENANGGNITICGGKVTATGGAFGAGIGVGYYGHGGNTVISGGFVTANGGLNGAGIGGGNRGNGGNIIISGGTVTATGGDDGAGIGGDNDGSLTVTGGYVIAKGGDGNESGDGGAGIGGHHNSHGISLTVTGGKITATAGESTDRIPALAIGRGGHNTDNGTFFHSDGVTLYDADGLAIKQYLNSNYYIAGEGSVFISAKTVSFYAQSDNEPITYLEYNTSKKELETKNASKPISLFNETTVWSSPWYIAEDVVTIDGRVTVNGDVRLILKNNCLLTVLGGIEVLSGSSLTIYAQSTGKHMGKLVADSNISGLGNVGCAGIGGSMNKAGGDITIHGGTVTAIGNGGGAGIGGGPCIFGHAACGNITIYDGIITATGGNFASGIGIGSEGEGGNVGIFGGTVYANGGVSADSVEICDAKVISDGEELEVGHLHRLVKVNTKAASCTETGISAAYYVCEWSHGCGERFADENGENPISDEEFEENYVIRKIAHTDGGSGICSICGQICVDFYEVPETVTNLTGANALKGEVDTLYIPSTVLSIDGAFEDLVVTNLVLKTTTITEKEANGIISMAEKSPVTLYCHKRTDGEDNISTLLAEKANVTVANILSSVPALMIGKEDDKNTVTSLGCINIPDLRYGDFKLVVTFKQGGEVVRTKEQTFTSVATTITGRASTDFDTAIAQDVAYIEGSYLVALTVVGVPAGSYTVETQIIAATSDGNGGNIEVCSEIASEEISVYDMI